MLTSSSKLSSHFVLIFRRQGRRKRGVWRSGGSKTVYSLIRRNYKERLEEDLFKTEPALG
jgi:hypothetical protein